MSIPLFIGILAGVIAADLYAEHIKKKYKKIDFVKKKPNFIKAPSFPKKEDLEQKKEND